MPLDEIAASLYAWDLADEGVDHCLDVLASRSRVNSAYLVGLMHEEKRPLHARFYPHNPVRRMYMPEDSRAYWKPDPAQYPGEIKPLTSDRDFLKGTDWLQVLIDGARARGMRTGCEISHTILDAAVARAEFPHVLQRDVFGEILGVWGGRTGGRGLPCLNHPEVQTYLVGLFRDLVLNYDVDYVQTCLILFGPGTSDAGTLGPVDESWVGWLNVATGGCFCSACKAQAESEGLDWGAITDEVRHLASMARMDGLAAQHERQLLDEANVAQSTLLLENDAFVAWLQFRKRSVNRVFGMVREATRAAGRDVEFRYNTYMANPEKAGLDFRSAFAHVDSVRESDYSDQRGTLEGVGWKRSKLMKVRRSLREDQKLIAALGVRPNATPETLRLSVKAAVEAGADGLSLGHYDGATMERLDAVADGVREWEGTAEFWQPLDADSPAVGV
ncbi:hypothetical protein Bcav_3556 [Beutenbergia cavernae DSM 12333]|uniref:Uncharacterized protein n=1 Tax=Beutenbergia cavernae (strain ATCC BAA-8 / DSM 12333 / CCUG 43141 / JCM 11478 / NBRC 16432 / NCIMB 13614 / HKI 0122) TaxID=471853 RepID=C5C2V4_BEUC1|nr:hypothetical protein [Beutenbergia cavernae]ACQ81798.1 hypothetical protein Bcav_3556 [Beutenbergia cavernae DSM 12333]